VHFGCAWLNHYPNKIPTLLLFALSEQLTIKNMQQNKNNNKTNTKNKPVTKNQVKQMIKSNSATTANYADGIVNSTSTITGTYTDLTNLNSGVGQNLRNGSSILLTSIRLSWSLTIADTTNIVRIVIFRWFPSNTVDVPQDTELFYGGSSSFRFCSPFQAVKPSRFKILYDKIHTLDVAHVINAGIMKMKLNFEVGYDNTVTTGTSHLYLCVISDSGGVPNPSHVVQWTITYDQ